MEFLVLYHCYLMGVRSGFMFKKSISCQFHYFFVFSGTNHQCKVKAFFSFRYEGSVTPILGTFNQQTDETDGTEKGLNTVIMSCEAKYIDKVPFGISITDKSKGKINLILT